MKTQARLKMYRDQALFRDLGFLLLAAGFILIQIFGLTGVFEGWFSDDAASVPISAKMHVLIGSVRIELLRWKRSNWTPPLADD